MPIDVESQNANTIFRSATWYLNATDHNYHVKGFVENTVSRAGLVLVVLNFYDNATGTRLATGEYLLWTTFWCHLQRNYTL